MRLPTLPPALRWYRWRARMRIAVFVLFGAGLALSAVRFAGVSDSGVQSPESKMQSYINNAREARGLRRLQGSAFLIQYSEARAITMRRNRHLLPHIPCFLCGEVLVVSTGNTWYNFQLWMHSPVHHHILMTPGITKLGCGMVSDRQGYNWWACEVRY